MKQLFDAVTTFSTESEQRRLVRLHRQFISYDTAQSINGLSHISRSSGDANVVSTEMSPSI